MRRILGTYHLDTVSPALPAPGHSSCGAGSSCNCPAPCSAPCSLFRASSAPSCCTRACNMARWHYSPFLFLLYNWAHKIFRAMYGWTKLFYLWTILELVSRGNNTSRTQHGPHFIVTLSTTYLNGIRGNKYPLSTILFYLHCITTLRDNGTVTGFML